LLLLLVLVLLSLLPPTPTLLLLLLGAGSLLPGSWWELPAVLAAAASPLSWLGVSGPVGCTPAAAAVL
jgi:hypothetical protein